MSGKQILLAAGFVLALCPRGGQAEQRIEVTIKGLCVPDQAGAASSGES